MATEKRKPVTADRMIKAAELISDMYHEEKAYCARTYQVNNLSDCSDEQLELLSDIAILQAVRIVLLNRIRLMGKLVNRGKPRKQASK